MTFTLIFWRNLTTASTSRAHSKIVFPMHSPFPPSPPEQNRTLFLNILIKSRYSIGPSMTHFRRLQFWLTKTKDDTYCTAIAVICQQIMIKSWHCNKCQRCKNSRNVVLFPTWCNFMAYSVYLFLNICSRRTCFSLSFHTSSASTQKKVGWSIQTFSSCCCSDGELWFVRHNVWTHIVLIIWVVIKVC